MATNNFCWWKSESNGFYSWEMTAHNSFSDLSNRLNKSIPEKGQRC
jgi:hypothetical protein